VGKFIDLATQWKIKQTNLRTIIQITGPRSNM